MPKNIDEEAMAKFVREQENSANQTNEQPIMQEAKIEAVPKKKKIAGYDPKQSQTLEEAQQAKKQELQQEMHQNGLGYIKIPVDSVPTRGIFYPDGTELWIRAATGGEIRHWSQTNETEITDIDDALNYMLERCLSVKIPGKIADWKDLKDIDRLYVILCIRDFTFPDGNNELMIKIDENTQLPLKKDNIDFINLSDKIMQYYNSQEKCFTITSLKLKNGKIIDLKHALNIYFPCCGVSKWLKDYIQRQTQQKLGYDKDFITMAPLLIPDYRGLTNETYASIIEQSEYFTSYEYAIIEAFKREISNALNPEFVYVDEGGMEQRAPLNFQGGFKSLFLPSVDIF